MQKHVFRFFALTTHLISEVEMLNMSEAQTFVALQTFQEDPNETQFRTNRSGCSRYGWVNFWPADIQYLLRT